MYAGIAKLESSLDSLLPDRRLNQSPGKELLQTARSWSEEIWKLSRIAGPLHLTTEQVNNGRNLVEHPVFICGVHRSGTTLVRDLLDAHPSLTVLPSEGSFRTNLATRLLQMPYEDRAGFLATEWLRRLVNPINQPPYWLLGRSTLESSAYVDFARAFLSWFTIAEKSFSKISIWPHLAIVLAYATCIKEPGEGLAAKFWVDKTPTQERFLKKIWHEMPAAKVIHIIRDPVNVFLSRKRMEPSLNLKFFLKDLQLSYQVAIKQSRMNKNNYLLLHYEELCETPQASIRRITEFLDIEHLPSLFNPTVGGKLANVNSSFTTDLPAGSIVKAHAHSNNEGLQNHEANLLSAYLFNLASQLGYSMKRISKIQSGLIKLKFELRASIRRKR